MEYLTFNRETNELFYRDSLTTFIDRVTFKVKQFSKNESTYVFILERHHKLAINELHFPIQNTILSIIDKNYNNIYEKNI